MKQTSCSNELCQFKVILISLSILAYPWIALKSEAGAITNKMRYGTSKASYIASSMPLEQVFELTAATSTDPHRVSNPHSRQNSYMLHTIHKLQPIKAKTNTNNINYKSLDDEDKQLLKKFYHETKRGDPFLGDSLTTESLWDEQEVGGVNALLDGGGGGGGREQLNQLNQAGSKAIGGRQHQSDATLSMHRQLAAPQELSDHQKFPVYESMRKTTKSGEVPLVAALDGIDQASYSPSVHLLTSYNPVAASPLKGYNVYFSNPKENRLVGATLYGQDKDLKPGVSSKSALEAVKLHDNLLKTPPRDGKVRVRMYYHRAIHDDERLYGTGPWKYWGHGWGLEFGYDPKSDRIDKDFYQKGYTIERAFGRDFCLDKNNCRQPDPDFFKDPKNVGKYSEHAAAAAKMLMNLKRKPKFESQRNSYEYRRV